MRSPLAGEWAAKHFDALYDAEEKARNMARRSGRAWTLEADGETDEIMKACPVRTVRPATAAEYRRVYERLRASGRTPLEAAKTRAHFDKLRTACRYCMEQDIRDYQAASERARRRRDFQAMQRRTEKAFRLAVVLKQMFIDDGHPIWAHKPLAERQPSKSKRNTSTPPPDFAGMTLLTGHRHGTKVGDRHALRLAVLSLTGCRPAELKKGVVLQLREGGRILDAKISGAKVGRDRGHKEREIRIPVEGTCATTLAAMVQAHGGRWTLDTTDADYRSLNRALQASGLSCYSFRHQVGSELKKAVSSGTMEAAEAAVVMGHRSTASLSYYGSRRRSRGGRGGLRARGTYEVRHAPHRFKPELRSKTKTTAKAKAAVVDAFRFPPRARPQAAPKAAPRQRLATRKPRPPRR